MDIWAMRKIVSDIHFPDYTFEVRESSKGYNYLVATYEEPDTITKVVEVQTTRRWPLSPKMTKSEIVSTAFKCVLTSMEHKTREWFTYFGAAIYQPHYNVDDLLSICEKREMR